MKLLLLVLGVCVSMTASESTNLELLQQLTRLLQEERAVEQTEQIRCFGGVKTGCVKAQGEEQTVEEDTSVKKAVEKKTSAKDCKWFQTMYNQCISKSYNEHDDCVQYLPPDDCEGRTEKKSVDKKRGRTSCQMNIGGNRNIHCLKCAKNGPAKCDPDGCPDSWYIASKKKCE